MHKLYNVSGSKKVCEESLKSWQRSDGSGEAPSVCDTPVIDTDGGGQIATAPLEGDGTMVQDALLLTGAKNITDDNVAPTVQDLKEASATGTEVPTADESAAEIVAMDDLTMASVGDAKGSDPVTCSLGLDAPENAYLLPVALDFVMEKDLEK